MSTPPRQLAMRADYTTGSRSLQSDEVPVGYSTYPDGSDSADVFTETVWRVNQELLHHGAQIALLRDLYRAKLR